VALILFRERRKVGRTIVYVDGFNMYYGVVSKTAYKWLNLKAIFRSILKPDNQIVAIKYYTANVTGTPDEDAPRRQQLYFDALSTVPEISICKGSFMTNARWLPIVNPPVGVFTPIKDVIRIKGSTVLVNVHKTEEKGSDVNLGVDLVNDGWRGLYDVAVVASNDTDLESPIRIVKEQLKKPVVLVCPSGPASPRFAHKTLMDVSSFTWHNAFTPERLLSAQFPNPVVALSGRQIYKPESW
jgi:uncharacterized LabA/DUF88 family protein